MHKSKLQESFQREKDQTSVFWNKIHVIKLKTNHNTSTSQLTQFIWHIFMETLLYLWNDEFPQQTAPWCKLHSYMSHATMETIIHRPINNLVYTQKCFICKDLNHPATNKVIKTLCTHEQSVTIKIQFTFVVWDFNCANNFKHQCSCVKMIFLQNNDKMREDGSKKALKYRVHNK